MTTSNKTQSLNSREDTGTVRSPTATTPTEPQAAPDGTHPDHPAYVAGMDTAKRLMTSKHTFSPEYVGMAVVQDALAALRAPAQGDGVNDE